MTEKSFGQFIALTRGKPFTRRGDEDIEIDGVELSPAEREVIFREFDTWEPPMEIEQ